jgi:hypothetical protein
MRKRESVRGRGTIALALLLGLGLAATGTPLPAQAADEAPTAETVLQKAIDALGGRDAMLKVKSRVTYGRMEIPAMGLKAAFTSYAERPGFTRTAMKSEAIGSMEEGGDGTLFWEQSAMSGPRLKKGPELTRSKRESDFDGMMNWKSWYASAELQGTADVEGKPAWKLVMTPMSDGDTTAALAETLFVDQESALPVKQSAIVVTEQGKIPVDVFPMDYRDVSGVKVPFRIKQSLMRGMQVVELLTDSVRVNIEVPAGTFDPPAEVKALIEKDKAAPAAKPAVE